MMKCLFLFLLTMPAFAGHNFNKVMVVVFENTDFSRAIEQPYFKSLAAEGALATNYHAPTHPSQGNYIAMVAGSLLGVTGDGIYNLDARHLGDLLEDAKKTWKTYAEGYPGNCFLGATSGRYARKHVPFLSFINIQQNPDRCSRIQDTKAFMKDFNEGTLPDYSLYIPDLSNDGHDTGVAYGDRWLKANFDGLIHSEKWPKDMLLIITFDEGSRLSDNRIYTLFWGANVKSGTVSNLPYDHYSLLHTVEEEFSLGSLGRNDQKSSGIKDIWKD